MMSNKPHLHLTDEVIDKYTDLIKARSPDSIHTFTTFFYTTLSANGYSKVSRWTKKVDIFSKEKLFIPIYKEQEKHWCLVYVNLKKKTIEYYDSFRVRNIVCLKIIFSYLIFEHLDKKGYSLNTRNWSLRNMTCPVQQNLWDCGVFICMFAEHLARDAPLNFSQKDMKRFRRQMKSEIEMKKLINPS